MPMFKWNEGLSVGVEAIDEQHKELLSILDDLYEAMTTGKDRSILDSVLDRLLQYVGTHFALEEEMMREHGYPDYSRHQAEHSEMNDTVFAVLQRREHGLATGVSVELLKMLRDWLTNHIQGSDARLGAFILDKSRR